jgi:trehalose 6-phosphate phosphatase
LLETRVKRNVEDFLEELARSRESALLLDYDGTLAPFQADRNRAFPYPGISGLLQDIMKPGHTRVVLITGRCAQDIVPLLGMVPVPEIWGAYGLQRPKSDGTWEMPVLDPAVTQALAEAAQWVDDLGFGNLIEPKPGGVAVHWRGLEDSLATSIREKVLLGWLPVADRARMTLQHFDGGVEIQVPGSNKGEAVREFLKSIDPATTVAYLGDDQPDEHAFLALRNRGLSILVRSEWRETEADLWLRPPEELLSFLLQWLAVCRFGR